MGIVRVILVLVALWLIISLVRYHLRKEDKPSPGDTLAHKKMVKCHYCDVFIPEKEALRDADKFYCNKAHRSLAERD